jgi:hypothetical protein
MALGPDMWGDEGRGAGQHPQTPQASNLSNDLLELFAILNERGIQYMLVGGVALLKYVSGRNTDDIDLIIDHDSLGRIPELTIEDSNPDAARARFRGLRVDLLFTRNPVFRMVLSKHETQHQFSEITVRCATIKGLVLLKLYALPRLYQQGDLQRAALFETDITMLAQQAPQDFTQLLNLLEPHLALGEAEELSKISAEIEQRLKRMQARR